MAPTSRRRFILDSCGCAMAAACAGGAVQRLVAFQKGAREITLAIPDADGVTIAADGAVLLVRERGRVMALGPACPHESAAVRWVGKTGRFECTKHNSRYQRDGTFISGRATRPLDRFPIRREGARVVITVDRLLRADRDMADWEKAVVEATGPRT